MTRRVPGYFHAQAATDGPPAPYVNVDVGPAPEPWSIAFLIDTGAEITTLGPRDSLTLLGRSYLTIDFSSMPGTREMIGIGQGSSRSFVTPTELTFFADDGSEIRITLGIAITEPVPPDPGAQGNWRMPSLLGRDVLQHFDLSLSYHPPSVTLTEAPAIPRATSRGCAAVGTGQTQSPRPRAAPASRPPPTPSPQAQ